MKYNKKKKEQERRKLKTCINKSLVSKKKKILNKIDIKYLNIPNICFSLTDKTDSREKYYSKQRRERGFDDSELWSLDCTIAKFLAPRLRRFTEHHCGYPGYMKNEQEWNEILDKITIAFELMADDDNFLTSDKEIHDKIESGLDLFRKYFHNLWD